MIFRHHLTYSMSLACVLFFLFSFDVFQTIDNRVLDRLFPQQQAMDLSTPIVLLTIDDQSIQRYGIWPWPRQLYTQLLNLLNIEHAKVIAFDINFDSHTSYNLKDDAEFGQAIAKAGNVVLARKVVFKKNKAFFLDAIPELAHYAQMGIAHPVQDRDYTIRNYRLLFRDHHKGVYPYFSMAVLATYLGVSINSQTVKLHDAKIDFGLYHIPLNKDGNMIVYFRGKEKSFPTIPISTVLEPGFLKMNPGYFANKIVLVGASAEYLQDLYPTPTSMEMPGVEIHANAIDTILRGAYLQSIPHLAYLLIILLITVLVSFVTMRLNAVAGLLSLIGISLGLVMIQKVAFFYHWIVYIVSPIASIFFAYVSSVLLRFFNAEAEKKQIRSIFNQYVSPSIVNELLAHKDKLKLGGDRMEVTVFFSDIRGFTTFSESRTPEEVVSQLNEYLNAMTEIIFACNGTLDKFVGDEIMAVWGAPLAQANHALLAVRCALKQMEALRELQAKWKQEGKAILDIGMGLNTGDVVVGNIGAEKYKDYTVIGDNINLGARLEAYTRKISDELGRIVHIIISDATKQLVEHAIEVAPLGEIMVKGKQKSVKIWEVLGEKVNVF